VGPLLKPHTWQWRGDYFDPEMPIPIELHYSLWNEDREKIAAPGVEAFWDRRMMENGVPALAPSDRLGFASLHLMRHVFRNNVRPAHAFELAQWAGAADAELWAKWRREHSPALRDLEAAGFCLASAWFGRPSPVDLPERVRGWFDRYCMSPLENLVEPNKHSLWLQLALVQNPLDRLSVVQRRLMPLRVPRREEAADGSYVQFLLSRVRYHAVALTRLVTSDAKARETSD
jgi:hypothetical protein